MPNTLTKRVRVFRETAQRIYGNKYRNGHEH